MSLRFSPIVIPAATTAYTVKDYNSGVPHIVADLTADCTFTMPAAKKGLFYRFQYGGGAADTADWVIQIPSGFYIGGVAHLTDGTPDIEAVYSDGDSNDFCRILTPEAGTWVEFVCDGTNWYVNGQAVSGNAPTFADT